MIIKSVTKSGKAGRVWVIAGVILIAVASYFAIRHWIGKNVAPTPTNEFPVSGNMQEPEPANLNTNTSGQTPTPSAGTWPESKLLAVPFTPQAPTANWDQLHNEACEEADALMADAYFSGRKETTLSPEYAENEIAKLTEWQKQNFGYYLDITTPEMAKMMTAVYGLKTKVIDFPTADQIKQEIANGNLVIFSANGQRLGNPNFRQPGPIHHMLLIKGYNKTGFVTNDSGTKRGLNYPYSYETLQYSAADWEHSQQNVNNNIKLAIIVSK
jgi:hypothetical protein